MRKRAVSVIWYVISHRIEYGVNSLRCRSYIHVCLASEVLLSLLRYIHLPFSLPVQLILIIICMFVPMWFLYSLSESTVLWPQLPHTVCSVDWLCSFVSYRAFVSKNVTILSVYMFILPKSYKLVQLVFCPLICVHIFTHDDFLHFFSSKSCPPHLRPLPVLVCIFFFLNKQDIKVLKIYCKQFMHLILVPVCSRVVIDLMF